MQRKRIESGCIYESRWTINECFSALQLAFFLCVSLLIARASVSTYVICSVLLSIVGCQFFLRKSYFYNHYMIVVYPLRFHRRRVVIRYNEVFGFVFRIIHDGEYLFIRQNESSVLFKQWFYSSRVTPKCKKGRFSFYYLLKHLKQQGYIIQTNKLCILEDHIESVFGSGKSDYIRKSPSERRKAHKGVWNTIIIIILLILLFFLSYWYYGTLS